MADIALISVASVTSRVSRLGLNFGSLTLSCPMAGSPSRQRVFSFPSRGMRFTEIQAATHGGLGSPEPCRSGDPPGPLLLSRLRVRPPVRRFPRARTDENSELGTGPLGIPAGYSPGRDRLAAAAKACSSFPLRPIADRSVGRAAATPHLADRLRGEPLGERKPRQFVIGSTGSNWPVSGGFSPTRRNRTIEASGTTTTRSVGAVTAYMPRASGQPSRVGQYSNEQWSALG